MKTLKTLKRRRGLALGVMMSDLVLTWGLHRPRAVRAKSRSRGPRERRGPRHDFPVS
jgi:hypothetical protein